MILYRFDVPMNTVNNDIWTRSVLMLIFRNNNKALFVKYHVTKYNGEFPIWVIAELFTLGMISPFYADMTTADKKELAKSLYGTTPKYLVSWLRCVTDLRNICAHYGRLYYRIFTASPAGFSISDVDTGAVHTLPQLRTKGPTPRFNCYTDAAEAVRWARIT